MNQNWTFVCPVVVLRFIRSLCYDRIQVQYGIFPDEFSFNLLLDAYIKEEDFKGATSLSGETYTTPENTRGYTLLMCVCVAMVVLMSVCLARDLLSGGGGDAPGSL